MREPDDTSLRAEATELLRDLLRVDTSNPPGRETPAALLLKRYLEAAGVDCELVAADPERANLVARIRGTGEGPSLAFLGHTDVVPADPDGWTHPPFAGHLDADGFVWGRGATDMKNETATRAVAMATLARSGFRPRGDLVFVAQADEEDGLNDVGLAWLVRARPDLRCDYAIDEGGGMRLELADGRAVVTVNVGEKAAVPARITALGKAGHTAVPASAENAVLRLATLVGRLADHRPDRVARPETLRMLELLAGPVDGDLDAALARAIALHPSFAEDLPPLFQTTIAPTRLSGSTALNVIPARATVECDCRPLPGTTAGAIEEELRAALGEGIPYELELVGDPLGGTASPVETPLFAACTSFLAEHDPSATPLPAICTGFCDMHYLREAFGTVAYGFWPVRRTPVDVYLEGAHDVDERIHVDDLVYAIRFHLHAARTLLG